MKDDRYNVQLNFSMQNTSGIGFFYKRKLKACLISLMVHLNKILEESLIVVTFFAQEAAIAV